jgi:hypothetical protein
MKVKKLDVPNEPLLAVALNTWQPAEFLPVNPPVVLTTKAFTKNRNSVS